MGNFIKKITKHNHKDNYCHNISKKNVCDIDHILCY